MEREKERLLETGGETCQMPLKLSDNVVHIIIIIIFWFNNNSSNNNSRTPNSVSARRVTDRNREREREETERIGVLF